MASAENATIVNFVTAKSSKFNKLTLREYRQSEELLQASYLV
jgi:hypothetical protein